MSEITLKIATEEDIKTVWEMQVKAFSDLLEKYQDYDMSPAAESFDIVMARYQQPWTTYYFIIADDETVGVIRVVEKRRQQKANISNLDHAGIPKQRLCSGRYDSSRTNIRA